jgi:hypothetical protein
MSLRDPAAADLGGDGRAAPDDRAPALELVDRQVDAVAEQRGERSLHALAADHALEVAVLAARPSEEPMIGTGGPRIDGFSRELQEVVGPMREAVPKRRARLVERDGLAQEAGEARKETRPFEHVTAPGHEPGRLSRSRR